MHIKTNLSNFANYGEKRNNIEYIVIHYNGNDGDKDENNANYFKDNIIKALAHYFCNDDSITQSVPDDRIAYLVGGDKYENARGWSFLC